MAREALGNNVKPINYKITIDTDLKNFVYSGKERIEIEIRDPVKKIEINAVDIDFVSAKVKYGKMEQVAKISVNGRKESATLSFNDAIKGKAELEIEFKGKNKDNMSGFYRSSYGVGENKKYILTTQFEATDARRAFPCFDEPALKAAFDLTLVIDDYLEAISNMPVKSIKRINGRKAVTFLATPPMSTYLLYMGVGNYERVSEKVGDLEVSVLTMPGMKRYAKLPLKFAVSFIKYYEKYFGIRYPLPKVDIIAIPDFAAGAMENWGAITFRETALLADENSSVATKQYVADVIAHELAHQWFGDLVTMEWWDDLWLNESFATFMSAKAVDALFPEWDYMLQYIDSTIGTALAADSLRSTHPINVRVNSPGEIDQIFDRISYEKGGSVLYMLENFVGKENFRKGLHEYLKAHSYSNATKYDLWNAIAKASKNATFAKVARAWIDKPGYPSIAVEKKKGGFALSQHRFTLTGNYSGGVWPIPLHYLAEKESGNALMRGRDMLLKSESQWIKLNYGQTGLYRVEYGEELLSLLGSLIAGKKLSDIDAWGIEGDLFALVRAGRRQLSEYLDFINAYMKSAGYPANTGVLSHLNWLASMLSGTKLESIVKEAIAAYSIPILSRLGWHTKRRESSIDTILRESAISSLGVAGHRPTIEKALSLFSEAKRGKPIDANIKSAVYSIAAREMNSGVYDFFVDRYKKETNPEERRRALKSLGDFSDINLLKKALELSLSQEIKLQDSYVIPAVLSGNPIGKNIIWEWSKRNWHTLMGRYTTGNHMLSRYVDNMGLMYGEEALKDLESFFSKKENRRDDIKLSIAQLLERVEINTNFMKANGLI